MVATCIKSFFKPTLILLYLLPMLQARAQKDVQFSQFSLNQVYYNPAAAGAEGVARFAVMHRTQYVGYQPTILDKDGAPSSQIITASVPFKNLGIGFYALNDRTGPLSQQDIQLSAAYKFEVSGGFFSAGVRAGINRQALDYDQLRPGDPTIDDPLIPTGTASEIQPDVAVGIRYENNLFYAGLSAVHLLSSNYALGTEIGTNPLGRAYYFNAGVFISAGYQFEVQPIVLVKATSGTMAAEGGILVTYNERYFGGITYRHEDAFAIIHAGASLLSDRSLRISGAYDLVKGGNTIKSPSSYEVMLSYALPLQKAGRKTIIRTPRFRY